MAKAKPAPVIKFYEVLNWLFSVETELPEKFITNKTKLNNIVPYLTEQFWTQPKLTAYLNKHVNNLHNIPDPLKMLVVLKKLIKMQNISKTSCWSFIPNRQPDLLKEIQERDQLDSGNALAKKMLMKKLVIDHNYYFKKTPTKKNIDLYNLEKKTIVAEALQKAKDKKAKNKEMAKTEDSRYLLELNQEVIDNFGLVLFDVSLLKKTNRVLFTFIDSDNAKKYFMVPFMADIYLSTKDGVINNDYIETKNDDFIHYVIKDIKLYTKLKFILNTSYKRIVNVGI